jgi:STE24 endopeptidase
VQAKFNAVSSAYKQALNLFVIKYDMMPYFWEVTRGWQETYFGSAFQGEIFHSVLFLFAGHLPITLLTLPFSIYSTFVLEEEYGFNKQTYGLFFKDLVISEALQLVIGAPLLMAFLKIIDYFGKQRFAFYVMIFLVVVQVVIIAIYPVLIQPLFNKLEPLKEGTVKSKTEELARKLKFPLGKLWVIDGSKRSAHSNAYFYGLPWSKQIVFLDRDELM